MTERRDSLNEYLEKLAAEAECGYNIDKLSPRSDMMMRRDTMIIDRFAGPYILLSNFAIVPVTWEGIDYPTSEHAYQAGKTLDLDERLKISRLSSAGQAKRAGRSVALRPNWDVVRISVMHDILRAKFTAETRAGRHLLSTGDALLVEGNYWHDQFWGDCRCARTACHAVGDNHLGRLLMKIRDELNYTVG